MKIAIPTIGSILDEYMNTCEVFTIFSIDDSNNIVETELLYTPEGCDCKNNIPLTMQQKGVTIMLAFKLPEHAEDICSQHNIKVYLGYSGNIIDVATTFIDQRKNQLI
jgi:predicted Fe-Mo cluster-binding NifX family protein